MVKRVGDVRRGRELPPRKKGVILPPIPEEYYNFLNFSPEETSRKTKATKEVKMVANATEKTTKNG